MATVEKRLLAIPLMYFFENVGMLQFLLLTGHFRYLLERVQGCKQGEGARGA